MKFYTRKNKSFESCFNFILLIDWREFVPRKFRQLLDTTCCCFTYQNVKQEQHSTVKHAFTGISKIMSRLLWIHENKNCWCSSIKYIPGCLIIKLAPSYANFPQDSRRKVWKNKFSHKKEAWDKHETFLWLLGNKSKLLCQLINNYIELQFKMLWLIGFILVKMMLLIISRK